MFLKLKFNIVNQWARGDTLWMNELTGYSKNPYNFHEMKNSFVQILSAPRLITVVSVRKLHSAIQSIDVLKSDGFVSTCQPFGNSNRL